MTPQAQDAARLQEILSAFYAGWRSRDDARSAVIDIVFDRIRCSRVSLWKFTHEEGGLALLCFAAKDAGGALDTTERRLLRSEYRAYFNALIERGTFVTGDAMNDPALQPMRYNYLLAHNVLSLLDAAFLLNGRAYGMICCEETNALRDWRAGDVFSLRSIVTQLALRMSSEPESSLWTTPSLPMRALPAEPEPPSPRPRALAPRRKSDQEK